MSKRYFVKNTRFGIQDSGILYAQEQQKTPGQASGLAVFTKISKNYILSFLLQKNVVECNLPIWIRMLRGAGSCGG